MHNTIEDHFKRLNISHSDMMSQFNWKWLLSLTVVLALVSLSQQQVIQTGLRNTVVVEGSTGTLQVILGPGQGGLGTWTKDSAVVSSTGRFDVATNGRIRTLTIRNAELVDAGLYTYTVDGNQTSANVTVTVFRIGLQDTTVDIGGIAYLQVILARSTTDNGTWYRNGVLVEPEPGTRLLLRGQNSRLLVIYNTQTSDAGVYTLGIRGQSTAATLRVGIMFLSRLSNTTVRVGDNATLTLTLSQPNIRTGYWSWNNVRLPSNDKYRISVGGAVQRLDILSIQRNEAGRYTYTLNGQESGARVTVLEEQELRFTRQLQSVTIPVGITVVLQTSLSQMNVTRGVWSKDGTVLANSGNFLITVEGFVHRLAIIKPAVSDSGAYTYNISGLTTTAYLNALDIRIVSPLSPVTITPRGTAVFNTVLSHADIRIGSWYKGTTELTNRDNIRISTDTRLQTLTISNVQLSDVGLYRYRIGDRETTADLSLRSVSSDVPFTICFVLDGSEVVGRSNFGIMRNSVKSFISLAFSVHPQTKACVVVFSDSVSGAVSCTSNLTSINDQIDNLRYPGGVRSTYVGINRARELLLQDTSLNPKFMVVIIAGLSDNTTLTEAATDTATRAGITVSAIGIDQFVRANPGEFQQYQGELGKIANSGSNGVIRQDEFSRLSGLPTQGLQRIQALFDGIRILQNIENTTVLVGESTTLSARLSIANATFAVWSKLGVPVLYGTDIRRAYIGFIQILTVSNVGFASAGTYTLSVGNARTSGALTVVGRLSNITSLENGSAVFELRVSPGDNPGSGWSRNGVQIADSAKYATARNGEIRQLTVSNVQLSDVGEYSFSLDEKTTSGYLSISAIVFEDGLQDQSASVGESVIFSLTLSATDIRNGQWLKNGLQLFNTSHTQIFVVNKEQRLRINNITVSDEGRYSYVVGDVTTAANLAVNRGIAIRNGLTDMALDVGQDVIFEVTLSQQNIERGAWYKNNVALQSSNTTLLSVNGFIQRLIILNVQLSDSGFYNYTVDTATTQATLTVLLQGITIQNGLTPTTIAIGRDLNFEVILTGQNVTSGVWYKDNIALQRSDRIQIFVSDFIQRLTIYNVQVSDSGVYRYTVDTAETEAALTVVQRECNADVLVVLDGSQSMGSTDFALLKEIFKQKISSTLTIFSDIRFGMLVFGSSVNGTVPLSANKAVLEAEIDSLGPEGGSLLAEVGINRARQLLLTDRFSTFKHMIVVIGSITTSPNGTALAAEAAQLDGINVLAVGVSRALRNVPPLYTLFLQELAHIGSSPENEIDYETVSNISSNFHITSGICETAVNGGFTDWGQWDNPQCSASCGGGNRTRTRRRTCTQPPPQFNGNDCIGDREQRNVTVCNTNPCDNPGFNPWGPWDNPQCSVTCGGGTRQLTRRRTCNNPPPFLGGQNCTGDFQQINVMSCNTFPCPIHGGFTDWGQWDNPACSTSCGGGNRTRTRRRTCTQPPPLFNGTDCIGDREQRNVTVCNTHPCNVSVDGQFSPWGPWDNPQCSVSCGGGTRLLTRRRTCDNPPPFLSGRNCTGDFAQINVANCNTFQCRGRDLCGEASRVNGVGYRYHPTDCDKYIQCYYNPNGNVLGVYRSCPFSYYWNQVTMRCDEPWRAVCPLETCNGSCARSYKMEGSCRSYWKCVGSHSEGKCCPVGHSFQDGKGCLQDYACEEECPFSLVSRDPCDKRPDWDTNPANYSMAAGTQWVNAVCETGTEFDILECSCVQHQEGTCVSSYTSAFTSQVSPSWMAVNSARIVNDNVILNASSTMVLNIEMMTINCHIVFTLRYRESSEGSGRRVLASSSDCRRNNSLVIYADEEGIHFQIKSWVGHVTKMMISTSGMLRTDWKRVSLIYNSKYLVGIVDSRNKKYVSRIHAPEASIIECGMRIGSDGSTGTATSFEGYIDTLSVYQCDPGDLY